MTEPDIQRWEAIEPLAARYPPDEHHIIIPSNEQFDFVFGSIAASNDNVVRIRRDRDGMTSLEVDKAELYEKAERVDQDD